MPTSLFSPLTAVHRPGQSLQHIERLVKPLSSPAGVFSLRANTISPRGTHDIDLILESPAEYDLLHDWYVAQVGSLIPFWLPSYQLDMVPVSTVNAADTDVIIHSFLYTKLMFPSTSRRAIVFYSPDGTMLKRDIMASVDNGDDTETITVNEALGVDFTPNRANGICFLWYGRLSDDVVQIQWDSAFLASAKIKMIELLDPPLGGSGTGGPVNGSFNDPGD